MVFNRQITRHRRSGSCSASPVEYRRVDFFHEAFTRFRTGTVPRCHQGVVLDSYNVVVWQWRFGFWWRCRIECPSNRIDTKPGFLCDLAGNAYIAATSRWNGLLRKCRKLLHFNFQQFSITPDMFVPLFLRQVEPVQVLADLPIWTA